MLDKAILEAECQILTDEIWHLLRKHHKVIRNIVLEAVVHMNGEKINYGN